LFGSAILLEFVWRILASMVGGFVAAGLIWLYGWWHLRRKFKRLEGVYEFVSQDGTPCSVTITYDCKRLLTVRSQGKGRTWEAIIEMTDICSHLGNGTYRYTDEPKGDLSKTPDWGLHQLHVKDANAIEILGTCSSDPSAEPFHVILHRKAT
jgi:hypothetical protein